MEYFDLGFSFHHFAISCHSFLDCIVSVEKLADNVMEVPLNTTR